MLTTPLIKWPGGKRAIAKDIVRIFPAEFGTYFEPFAGGAALYFLLRPNQAVLSDKNGELINLYRQVQQRPQALIERLQQFKNDEESYYLVRKSNPSDPLDRAARIYYLMLLSFNGIYRVNQRGEFNVPYGHKIHLLVADEGRILSASQALQNAILLEEDFERAVDGARAGDLVYFDPPYTVAHSQNGFLKYNEVIFSYEDQKRLAACARTLAQRGCFVAVSNANHHSIAELYAGFHLKEIARTSKIAATARHRIRIAEHVYFLWS